MSQVRGSVDGKLLRGDIKSREGSGQRYLTRFLLKADQGDQNTGDEKFA